jgi:hypothetical protein
MPLPRGSAMPQYLDRMGIDRTKPNRAHGRDGQAEPQDVGRGAYDELATASSTANPEAQIILNYAPGQEEANARRIYANLRRPDCVFIDVQAKSPGELLALSNVSRSTSATRAAHAQSSHAAGRPSFVVCAPPPSSLTGYRKTRCRPKASRRPTSADTTDMTDRQNTNSLPSRSVGGASTISSATHHNNLNPSV